MRKNDDMPNDPEDDLPTSHAIADGWEEFAKRILPSIVGTPHAEAKVAFHFGAIYVLQLTQEMIAERSSEAVSLALEMLGAELDAFLKAHAAAIQ
jgi:hypothetical protein